MYKFLLTIAMVMFSVLASTDGDLNVLSRNVPRAPLLTNGVAVDEVVVESSLYIKPKPKRLKRVKRGPQFYRTAPFYNSPHQYGQSQAISNAAANNQYNSPFGSFESAAANAQAQAFHAQGPTGSFGATSAGSVTQALNANPFGQFQNTAGASMSQTYMLPSGQTINFASTNSLANSALGNNANSRGGAVSVSDG